METFVLIIGVATIAHGITLSIILVNHRETLVGKLVIIFMVTIVAYVYALSGLHDNIFRLPLPIAAVLYALAVSAIYWFWLFVQALLKDSFRLQAWHWAFLIVVVGTRTILFVISEVSELPVSVQTLSVNLPPIVHIIIELHILWSAFSGLRDDLVESRRRFRVLFVSGTAGCGLVIAAITISTGPGRNPEVLNLTIILIILALMVLFGIRIARLLPGDLFFRGLSDRTSTTSAADRYDIERILAAMETAKLYRQLGLTIKQLGIYLELSEHQVRRIINSELGFRNFGNFVNRYRIDEAQKKLADPALARSSILTIAHEVGFQSLAPFNRAFRENVNMAPREYRQIQLLEVV